MKKGFSLVEIMQTVFLLGIIAGLSVSFFRKINYDERLYTATETMIKEAVPEAARQACSDDTLSCGGYTLGVNADNSCIKKVSTETASTFNKDTQYCEYVQEASAACSDDNFELTYRDGKRICYRLPYCTDSDKNIVGTKPDLQSKKFCPDGVPDLSIPYKTNSPYSLFCVKLHELLNHKPQDDDLDATCSNNTVFANANEEADVICKIAKCSVDDNASGDDNASDDVNNVLANCPDTIVCPTNKRDNYNMLLPNGVRLYNLNGFYPVGDDKYVLVVVKFDRLAMVSTAKYEKVGGKFRSENIRILQFDKEGKFIKSYPEN